jgi:copper transport protein
MTWRRLLRVLMIALCAVGVLGAPPAWAEPVLTDGTSPADQQTLPQSPSELLLVFTEPLSGPPSLNIKEQASGLPVSSVGVAAQGDSADQWIVPLTAPLNNGVYQVTWVAGASNGSYVFSIGVPAPATTLIPLDPAAVPAEGVATSVAPADGTSGPATAGETAPAAGQPSTTAGLSGLLGRWISSLGIAALAGALMLIAFTWPEGVEYAITIKYLRAVWIMALIGTLIAVGAERAMMTGDTFVASLSPSGWSDLTDTKPGLALLARLLFVILSAWVAFGPERAIDAATQIPAFAAPGLALLTFGFARTIESGLGALMIPASIVHAVAVAAWFGGLALLVSVVLAGPGDEDLVHAIRGFSRLAAPALIGVFFSGLFMVARNVGGLSNLLGSGYGRVLLLKVVAFVFMLRVALANRATVAKRLSRNGGLGPKAAERLRRSIGSEALAGVVVLGLTASLFTQTPEGIEAVAKQKSSKADKPVKAADMDGPGVRVNVGVGPAKAGLNDLTIIVSEPATGLVALDLSITGPAGDPFIIEVPVSPSLRGEGTLAILDVPFCTAGTWTVNLSGQNTEGQLPQIRSSFDIETTDEALPTICSPTDSVTPPLPAPPGVDPVANPTLPTPAG